MTPQIMKSPLTGRFYLVTSFYKDGSACMKYDCTEAVNLILEGAAAPTHDLLKALVNIRDTVRKLVYVPALGDLAEALDQVDAAIAKVRGDTA